jgi:hypothetical protein
MRRRIATSLKREIYRHGIVSGIIILPNFRLSAAVLDCEKEILRWPGPFGSGFLSPQPPGVVRIGPVRKKHTPILGQRELVLFLFGLLVLLKRFLAKACPGLDPGWVPVRVKNTRQNRRLGSSSASPDRGRGRHTLYASCDINTSISPAAPTVWSSLNLFFGITKAPFQAQFLTKPGPKSPVRSQAGFS